LTQRLPEPEKNPEKENSFLAKSGRKKEKNNDEKNFIDCRSVRDRNGSYAAAFGGYAAQFSDAPASHKCGSESR
jgi:hypothetical protein